MDLRVAVAAAIGAQVQQVSEPRRSPIDYDVFLPHRAVSRITGTASTITGTVAWSFIEKTTGGPGLASPYLTDNARRERAAYRSGLLDDLAPALRAPVRYGDREDVAGTVLWLEEVHHDGARPLDAETLTTAATALGWLAGRWVGRVPTAPWFFTGWIDRHRQPAVLADGLRTLERAGPHSRSVLGERLSRARTLLELQESLPDILADLPLTLCHHDATGANVFRSGGEVVLIDWESVGPGTVGADLASLLFSSVRRGDATAATVLGLEDELVNRYTRAASEASGGALELGRIRRGLDAAIALRWTLLRDLTTAIDSGASIRRGSTPDEPAETAMTDLIALADRLLAAADRVGYS